MRARRPWLVVVPIYSTVTTVYIYYKVTIIISLSGRDELHYV